MPLTAVISQSMYFPWIGLLEQIKSCDVYVRMDNVQFARGFMNRVQIKGPKGLQWLTVPLPSHNRRMNLCTITLNESLNWRGNHLRLIKENYRTTPFCEDAIDLAEQLFQAEVETLSDLSFLSIQILADYFGLSRGVSWVDARDFQVHSSGSDRIQDLTHAIGADTYLTGLGGQKYLDHEKLESSGIEVRYMDYAHKPWPQQFGPFTPYTTALDLVANVGPSGADYLTSKTQNWRLTQINV